MSIAAQPIEALRTGYLHARDNFRIVKSAALIHLRKPRRVVFFNPYYADNPYQALMYRALAPDTLAVPLSISGACRLQQLYKGPEYIFHQHWLESSILASNHRAKRYLDKLKQFRASGGKILWTLHNAIAHEPRELALEVNIRTAIGQLAHGIHLHYAQAADILKTYYPLPAQHIIIAPHGHYDEHLAPYFPAAPLAAHTRTLRFFSGGLIRGYKGLEELCHLFDSLPQGHAQLVLAGRKSGQELRTGRNIEYHLHLRRIGDADMCRFIRSCHFTVLPYKRSLTSGMLLYSLTCGVPVIAPDYGHFSAIIDGSNGILYNADNPDGLRGAIETARSLSTDAYEQMRSNARATALRYPWAESTEILFS